MKINNRAALAEAIQKMKTRRKVQEDNLVSQFHLTYERLQPVNLLKEGINRVVHTPGFSGNLVKTIAGFGMGVVTKKLFLGKPNTFVTKLLGTAVELTVTKTAVNNGDKIKAYAIAAYNNLFKKKNISNNNHVPKLRIF
jgi:hypothetical protein